MTKKTELLELILAEIQLIRTHLEVGPPSATSNYTFSTSTYGGEAVGPAQGAPGANAAGVGMDVTVSWDPGTERLKEMLDNPDGELNKKLQEMPVVERPKGKSVYEMVEGALAKHDEDLLNEIKRRGQ